MMDKKLKYAILVPDGAADYPLKELDGKTPLQTADTPNMDELAAKGCQGLAVTLPEELPAGSDVANLGILGYNPLEYYTGRGPLEAAYHGVDLGNNQWAFRCNLVTIDSDNLVDYSAGHITSKEAKTLIEYLQQKLGSSKVTFYPGVSYRHLTIISNGFGELECIPPHDIIGQKIKDNLPIGEGSELLKQLIFDSGELLQNHPVNIERIKNGQRPANSIWLWGEGQAREYPSFESLFNLKGAVISAVDLLKGIAKIAGMEVVEVPGATGYFDTDYQAKAEYGLKALERNGLVFIHVEAPDEAGHIADIQQKIGSIENFDKKIVSRYLNKNVLLLPDHLTPIGVKTHVRDPVPFLISGKGIKSDDTKAFSEEEAANGSLGLIQSHKLIRLLFGNGKQKQ